MAFTSVHHDVVLFKAVSFGQMMWSQKVILFVIWGTIHNEFLSHLEHIDVPAIISHKDQVNVIVIFG